MSLINPESMFNGPFTFRVRHGQHDGSPRGEGGSVTDPMSERFARALAHGLPKFEGGYAFPETLDAEGCVNYWYISVTGIRGGSTSGGHDTPTEAAAIWERNAGDCREISITRYRRNPTGRDERVTFNVWRKS